MEVPAYVVASNALFNPRLSLSKAQFSGYAVDIINAVQGSKRCGSKTITDAGKINKRSDLIEELWNLREQQQWTEMLNHKVLGKLTKRVGGAPHDPDLVAKIVNLRVIPSLEYLGEKAILEAPFLPELAQWRAKLAVLTAGEAPMRQYVAGVEALGDFYDVFEEASEEVFRGTMPLLEKRVGESGAEAVAGWLDQAIEALDIYPQEPKVEENLEGIIGAYRMFLEKLSVAYKIFCQTNQSLRFLNQVNEGTKRLLLNSLRNRSEKIRVSLS